MRKLLFVIAIALFACYSCNNNNSEADAFGSFEAEPVIVSALGQGLLEMFTVEEGQSLKKGVSVGVIDTMQQYLKKVQLLAGMEAVDARKNTLEAGLKAEKISIANVERELSRLENLYQDGAATGKQLDDLKGQLSVLRAKLKSTEARRSVLNAEKRTIEVQLDQVDDLISRSVVTNPVAGIVLQKYRQEGETVAPGLALYKIADTRYLILRAYISGSQLSSIAVGQDVTVFIDTAEGLDELPGKVTWISATAEFTPKIIQTREERVNLVYAVKVKVKNDGRLKIGMPGEMNI